MTDDQISLLADFERKVRGLIALCDQQKKQKEELTRALESKDEELKQAMQTIRELEAKYDYLLIARRISVTKEEKEHAKKQLLNFVREVNKCIALLNE